MRQTALVAGPSRAKAVIDWLLRDRRTGAIVIAQLPNPPLWVFLATVGARWFLPTGSAARTIVDWVGVVALAWWALDEVLRGVNPFRRLLGLAGAAFVVAGVVELTR